METGRRRLLPGREQLPRHSAQLAVARLVGNIVRVHRAHVLALQNAGGRSAVRHDRNVKAGLRVHAGLEPSRDVFQNNAHAHGARRLVQEWLDERHLAGHGLRRFALQRDLDRLALADPGQVGLVDFQHEPHLAQIGDGVQRVALLDVLPRSDVLLDHRAAQRGVDNQVRFGRSALGQFIELLLRKAPQLEPP